MNDFDGMTVYPTTGGRWQASTKTGDGWNVHVADTIEEAITLALGKEIDMARKPAAKKSNNEVATRLQEALKFLSVGFAASGDEQATHTWFEAGWGCSFNGIVAAATPIEGLDLVAFPDTALLTAALGHVGKNLDITVEDGGVHIVSGEYDAYVPVGDRSKTVPTSPDNPVAELPAGFLLAMERASRVVSDTAQTVRDSVVWAKPVAGQNYSQTFIGTNGKALIEADFGGYLPPGLCFPKAFQNALAKCGRTPTKWGFSPNSFTVWFDDNSYLKTNLYDPSAYPASVADRSEAIFATPSLVPPPKGFFEAVAAVAPFGDGSVYFLGGHVRSGPSDDREEWACSVAVDKLPDGVKTNAKGVLLFKEDAQQIYFGSNDDEFHRVVVIGPGYRAAVGGSRSDDQVRPVEAPPTTTPAAAPGWGTPPAFAFTATPPSGWGDDDIAF